MNAPQLPFVSIIIPAYYSLKTLPECLDALEKQTYRSFEVILINSSPEPQTESWIHRRHPEVKFEQHPVRLLPHAARNRGVSMAKGNLLVFTDPDCYADASWLEQLVLAIQEDCQALVGAMDVGSHNLWEKTVHLIKYHWLLRGLDIDSKFCAPTANAAYTRWLWDQIGPFPGGYYAGDGILSYRAAKAGHAPRFVPSAVVHHRHFNSVLDLLKERFLRGRDYARAQLCEMPPTRPIDWLRLIVSWTALPIVLVRATKDAYRCGWLPPFLLTLPIQAMGHGLWEFGESWGAVETLIKRFLRAGAK
jgi:GT2 family glycosyltransferase